MPAAPSHDGPSFPDATGTAGAAVTSGAGLVP